MGGAAGRRRHGRRRAARPDLSKPLAAVLAGVLTLILAAGLASAVTRSTPAGPPGQPRPSAGTATSTTTGTATGTTTSTSTAARTPARNGERSRSPAARLRAALQRTLGTSFHVSGTVRAGTTGTLATFVADLDLPRRSAVLAIRLAPALAAERILLLPGHTYTSLVGPIPVTAALPHGVAWVEQPRSLPALLLDADGALVPLHPAQPASHVVPLPPTAAGRRYLLTRPAPGGGVPADTVTYTVAHGYVVAVVAVSYTRIPFAEGGLASVLVTTIELRLSDFGERFDVRAPPSGRTVSARRYEQLVRAYLPPARSGDGSAQPANCGQGSGGRPATCSMNSPRYQRR